VHDSHVYGNNYTGISMNGSGSTVYDNIVHDNVNRGISAGNYVIVSGNRVYGHDGSNGSGIAMNGGTTSDNIVYANTFGISGNGIIEGNRVFANLATGIRGSGNSGTITDNDVYDNPLGIAVYGNYSALCRIDNNRIYDSSDHALLIQGGNNYQISNNTIIHNQGDAVSVLSNVRNVALENNIIAVAEGHALIVANDSQQGFSSDYNLFHLTGSGMIADWEGVDFSSLVDWIYELGFDSHSQTADPLLVNPDGADMISGFSSVLLGAPIIIDDGDAGFSFTGTWQPIDNDPPHNDNIGYGGDILFSEAGDGENRAVWNFSGLTPGWYRVAVSWAPEIYNFYGKSSSAPYMVSDGSKVVGFNTLNYNTTPDGFVELTTVLISGDTLTVELGNDANGKVLADAVMIQQIEGEHGQDDDLRLQPLSPAIDGGNPLSFFLSEPFADGGRINQGAYGNTAEAAQSAARQMQILTPNGLEKFEAGQEVMITWQSTGLVAEDVVTLINTGGETVSTIDNGVWLANQYQSVPGPSRTISGDIDSGSVAQPAPLEVYAAYTYAASGVGNSIAWHLPVPDGDYNLRLHFVEPNAYGAGSRMFDIKLQDETVQTDFDIFAEADGVRKALVKDFTITALSGQGIDIELLNKTYSGAVLSAIELTRSNAEGVDGTTANLE
jgi:hypothetical protein